MRLSALERRLEQAHRSQPAPSPPESYERLAAELAMRHRQLYGRKPPPRSLWRPATLAAVASILLLAVGASPTSRPIVSGELLRVDGLDPGKLPDLSILLDTLRAATPGEQASVSISQSDHGSVTLVLFFFDRTRPRSEVLTWLRREVPATAGRPLHWDVLEGRVAMTVAERARRAVLAVEWSPGEKEAARRRLLGQLALAGARVGLAESGEERRIEIVLPRPPAVGKERSD